MEKLNAILGYKKEVKKLKSICDFLKNTEKYIESGAKIPKGLVLYGETGVGKTLMAKALIEDCERAVFELNCNSKRAIKRLFKKAKKAGRAVILIDDIDYLYEAEECEHYRYLSCEMSEIANGEIFIIATAEKIDYLPEFLLGENGFGLKIELSVPEYEDACKIFESAFKDRNIVDDFSLKDFCYFACGWTYPMVERILNNAALTSVYEGSGKISMQHIVKAALQLNDTCLAEEYDKETALHEAGHAAVNMLLGGQSGFLVLTENGGHFKQKESKEDSYDVRTRGYIVGMAGKACAELFLDTKEIGAYSDLKNIAEGLENDLSKLAVLGFDCYDSTKNLDSPEFNNRLVNNIQSIMQNYYDKAKALLEQNKQLVIAIAEKLKENHFLLSSELHKIYDDYLKSKNV